MRLSSMADYAVVIMSAAARHCGGCPLVAGDSKHGRVSAAQLAEETRLPAPTVQKLVSKLTAAGLLISSRGVGGGLKLARSPESISVADIVEAVEGPIALTACLEKGKPGGNSAEQPDCQIEGGCHVRPHWPQVNAALRGALAQVALTQLVEEV
ncbi:MULTISPECIES: RrF2 family transcriptional regulator [Sphingomonadaceae]|uniref:RrF2 family transcriptional regulator n=1 Tax=Sphingomonadaceae TaxID=41297 RepID=UPI001157C84C|nr:MULTISPECIES: Rrf2 family transcriptional regulator [Sphingomonadaceae]QDK34307.1 AsnC family transcriptional regulator [Sphingomonas sp. IC081]QSR16885.1 AsnC family transcriptional regulator [Novosphingobium sp. KA1]